jgi:hypothetical protein
VSDPTEAARREMVPMMPTLLQLAIERGDPIWTTERLREDFEVLGFLAPFVHVKRRADGAEGVMTFTHNPRYYWGFEEST